MAGKPPWGDLPPELLRLVFELVQLHPEGPEDQQASPQQQQQQQQQQRRRRQQLLQQEVAMQTVCKPWCASWATLPLESCLELLKPAGQEGIRTATSWMAKQGFSRLRRVSTASTFVLSLLAGCKELRSMRVNFKGPHYPDPLFGSISLVTSLRSLDLRFVGDFPDCEPLAFLPSLDSVCFELHGSLRPHIDSLSHLRGLTALVVECYSHLAEDRELDLTHLSHLTALVLLRLEGSTVAGLGPLADLQQLTSLVLRLAPIVADLHALRGMTGLQVLQLQSCAGLQHLRPLGQLGALQDLKLSHASQLSDICALAAATSLTSVDLSDSTALVDLRGLAGLQRLAKLHLSSILSLVDIRSLARVTSLRELIAFELNALSDIGPLKHLSALERLVLAGCEGIINISPVSSLTALQYLSLYGCDGVASLAPLAGLVSLHSLYLGGNGAVLDLVPLAGLTRLTLLAAPGSWQAAAEPTLGPLMARGLKVCEL